MNASEDQHFIEELRAAPAEDEPRLVYADWLEENGRIEQATYLRLEIELSRDLLAHDLGSLLDSSDPQTPCLGQQLLEATLCILNAPSIQTLADLASSSIAPDWPTSDWLEATRIRFDAFLEQPAADAEKLYKLDAVKEIKFLTDCSLLEAKLAAEGKAASIQNGVNAQQAIYWAEQRVRSRSSTANWTPAKPYNQLYLRRRIEPLAQTFSCLGQEDSAQAHRSGFRGSLCFLLGIREPLLQFYDAICAQVESVKRSHYIDTARAPRNPCESLKAHWITVLDTHDLLGCLDSIKNTSYNLEDFIVRFVLPRRPDAWSPRLPLPLTEEEQASL